ncbi:uncharacterized protein N7482_003985 [Penicillium canariense]|uniref:Uncharacterized protein n=1 Tax=Penicillium canariense TaxID=189055 RepID=A0A9W9I7J0_9EURO|nr:uncharacterized protein N7482_003985 [Penicillium canariense]KAJ5168391.1 hypothetical protein N7482_003985 [Penicillium canariense]
MIRQLFTAASPARIVCPISTATLKAQVARQPTWRLANTSPLSLRTTRSFSSTLPAPFTSTALQYSSPFRLSSDKHESSHSPNPNDEYYSPYKPKRQWPPDMSKLSPKHQFRLERKYRRRAALKYARPKFIKAVTLAQWMIIGFVVIYAVLFMQWDTKDTPFDGIRESVFAGVKAVFSSPPSPGPVKRAGENTGSESQN